MRSRFLRSLTIFTLAVGVVCGLAWTMAYVKGQSNGQQPQTVGRERRRTLREIAQDRDVDAPLPELHSLAQYSDLRDLARDAHAVVVGRIVEEESYFDGDDSIMTRYAVDVQRVLKEVTLQPEMLNFIRANGWELPAPLTKPLRLVRSGGIVYENGHRVSRSLKGSESLTSGKNYILFLWWNPDSKAYNLAGGISGVALVDSNARIHPLASSEEVKRKHKGDNLETFISEVLNNQ